MRPKKSLYLLIPLITATFFSCEYDKDIKDVFDELIAEVDNPKLIEEFKSLELDSAILNYKDYPEIFNTGLTSIMKDSINQQVVDRFYGKKGMNTYDAVHKGVFIGSFHKILNNQPVDAETLEERIEKIIPYGF